MHDRRSSQYFEGIAFGDDTHLCPFWRERRDEDDGGFGRTIRALPVPSKRPLIRAEMSTTPSRHAILSLYSNMLRTSRSFASYNFRTYFIRNARVKFRQAATETDPARIQAFCNQMTNELKVLQRSVVVNRLFEGPKLVVEKARPIVGGGGAGMEAGAGGAGQPV